ncbi:MAG: Nif3-like dinuclear metal center hexameric protein [Eubacteriales bacterium]|nr:Nif3-like dinuclear metal center hexameric protein [Eubacteriales bacterium]
MTTVQDILTFLEGFAPPELAESWDNVGLLCGDRTQTVTGVLCALDVTEEVVAEAAAQGAELIVAHHPAIFTSVSRVTADDATGRILRAAIRQDIALICMHTNADCARGGVNDALASALFLTGVVDMEAGENKMLGRVGDLPREMQPREFAHYVKECLHAGGVQFCDGGKPIRRVAVGGGACGKLMDQALAKGADAFVIGDHSYDLMQRAQSLGLTLVDAGHFPTEDPVVAVFAAQISGAFPSVHTAVSVRHTDCIQFV